MNFGANERPWCEKPKENNVIMGIWSNFGCQFENQLILEVGPSGPKF